MNKYANIVDLVARRYGVRPSSLLEINEEFNNYYCWQFDLAVAAKSAYNEAKAKKDAYDSAEKEAKDKPITPNSSSKNSPSTPDVKMPKLDQNEMLRKMSGINLNNFQRNPPPPPQ